MALLTIKTAKEDSIELKGRLTFETVLVEDEETNEEGILIKGSMTTHSFLESIESIKTCRYELTGIKVIREVFGSDDFDILYEFIAEDYRVIKDTFNDKLIARIEAVKYKDDDSNLWEGDE